MNCGVGDLRNYTVATDLNLCNVVLLMMNHSSCHVCVWSDHGKDALHKKGNQRTNSGFMNLFCDFFESRNQNSDQRNLDMLSTSYTLWQHR